MKMVNESYVFLMGFILSLEKTFLLFHRAFFNKMFICSRVGTLDSLWCSNSCRINKLLGQGNFYYSITKKLPAPSVYLQPTPNVTTRKFVPTSTSSIIFITELTSIGLDNFWTLLISSKLSTINNYIKIPTFFIDEY